MTLHVRVEASTFARQPSVDYRGRTVASKRAGKTVKVSVSLESGDLAVLKRYAKSAYDGNLSAAFAAAAKLLRQREARQELVDLLGGPTLTRDAAAAIDAEQAGATRAEPKRSKKRSAA